MSSESRVTHSRYDRMFAAGTLRARIAEVSRTSLASGHLIPYATVATNIHDRGFDFAIRMLDPSVSKPRNTGNAHDSSPPRNPFLPYERELFVAPITSSYVGLLNKFKVVDEHLLLVTREFVAQTAPLTSDDFLALAYCLQEFHGLGFYNGGMQAGASQPHRHLQLIPLPLGPQGSDVPFDRAVARRSSHRTHQWQIRAELPFSHRWTALDRGLLHDPLSWSRAIALLWEEAQRNRGWNGEGHVPPYNLLITRDWMLFVPRRQECFADISLNAMAFVGALFVRNEVLLASLAGAGPMQALIETAGELA